MPFNISKYTREKILEIEKKVYDLINPHFSNFQNIVKSITKSYPKFYRHYEVDEVPNIKFSESDSTFSWSLTFTDLWDNSKDICNSEVDTAIIDKVFEMQDKIIKELKKYCDKNGLKINFTNDNTNWDDVGIYCSMNINFIISPKRESSIFDSIELL